MIYLEPINPPLKTIGNPGGICLSSLIEESSMRLGVIFNVFDSEELLEGNARQVRPFSDYIIAVVQEKSNFGNKYNGGVEEAKRLNDLGFIDEIFWYDPYDRENDYSPNPNEIAKRNSGIKQCIRAGCTHYLLIDCDEYYDSLQFVIAMNLIENFGYDSTACRMKTYFKKPTYEITPPEEYFVPFIQKLNSDSMCGNYPYPVYADATRLPNKYENAYIYKQGELVMHHFSHVRNNYRMKLENSSASVNWKNKIDSYVQQYENFKIGDEIPFYPDKKIVEVPNIFHIKSF